MMARRRKSDDHENLERWLLTYADLITLLLAFFIVMYSMSQIDAKKFGEMSKALSGVLRGGGAAIKKGDEIGTAPGKGVMKIGHLISIGQRIKEKFGQDNLSKTIDIPVRLQKPVLTLAAGTSGSKGAVIRNGDTARLDLTISNRAGIDARNVEMKLSVAEKGPKIITDKNIKGTVKLFKEKGIWKIETVDYEEMK